MFPFKCRVCIESQFMITGKFIDKTMGRNFLAHFMFTAYDRINQKVKTLLGVFGEQKKNYQKILY